MEIIDKYKKKSIIEHHTLILEDFKALREYNKQIKRIHKKLFKNFNLFSEMISGVSEVPNLINELNFNELKEVEEIYEMIKQDDELESVHEYNDDIYHENAKSLVTPIINENDLEFYKSSHIEVDKNYDPLDIEIKISEDEIVLNKELDIKEDLIASEDIKERHYIDEFLEEIEEEDIIDYTEELINSDTNNHFSTFGEPFDIDKNFGLVEDTTDLYKNLEEYKKIKEEIQKNLDNKKEFITSLKESEFNTKLEAVIESDDELNENIFKEREILKNNIVSNFETLLTYNIGDKEYIDGLISIIKIL